MIDCEIIGDRRKAHEIGDRRVTGDRRKAHEIGR